MNETAAGGSSNTSSVMAAMPSPSNVADTSKAITYDFDPSISEEERRFYLKAYSTVEAVRERRVHCTVCKTHIGTAPGHEPSIKMHPILRVTHCMKCHDFYNSGEFSKGEDGSELYCRWCGQGGEVYCCSSCPYVFCKSCIVKNLSKGVVADIEQNENWNCFSCAPKILWPLRAQHWALMNYLEVQKKEIVSMNLPEHEYKVRMAQDRSKCCRLAKSKCGNMSDSMESLDSVTSKRSHGSSGSAKKPLKHSSTPSPQLPSAKRAKTNDEVVCTPDLLSMLEPDCQITVTQKNNNQRPMPSPSTPTPRIMSIPTPNFCAMSTPKSSAPPPLVLRNTAIKLRPAAPAPIVRRTVIGPRTPLPGGNGTPVYHTINGYRIDLNSAAQQETFRLPNGKLIQVKRQGPPPGSGPQHVSPSTNSWQIQTQPSQQLQQQQQQRVVPQTIASRPVQITQHPYPGPNMPQASPQHPPGARYHGNVIGSTTINAIGHNGAPLQVINGQISSQQAPPLQQQSMPPQMAPGAPIRPVMVRHIFPDNPIGSARTQLQEQVFNAMEICTHLTNKVQTLTNSNAYKQARNYLEVKELYIHLSYLLTYAIGRFKGLQDKCLTDMRKLGFGNDADSLENGQLAADKQASDDEDNEIEIVEPKTDLITLDSDDDEPPPPPPPQQPVKKSNSPMKIQKHVSQLQQLSVSTKVVVAPQSIQPQPPPLSAVVHNSTPIVDNTLPDYDALIPPAEDNMDLMSMAQSFLASMLEVDINEGSYGPQYSPTGGEITQPKKQPRKKLTNKPNPTLLKQKARIERERLEEMKRNDLKLKMQCAVQLKKAEDEYPFAKQMLKAKILERQEQTQKKSDSTEGEKSTTVMLDMGKETLEVQFVIVDDNMNSSTEENGTEAIINISGEESPQKKIISSEKNQIVTDEKDSKISEKSPEKKKDVEENREGKESSDDVVKDANKCDEANELGEGKAIEETRKDKENHKDTENEIDKENSKGKDELSIAKENNEDNSDKMRTKEVSNETEEEPMERDTTADEMATDEVDTKEVTKDKNNVSKECDDMVDDDDKEDNNTDDITLENDNKIEADISLVKKSCKQIEPMEEEVTEATAAEKNSTELKDENEEQNMDVDKEDDIKSPLNAGKSVNEDDVVVKPNEDAEDAEVYEEIEKVLQRRRDSEIDTTVNKNEIFKETELEKESETKTAIEPLEEEKESAGTTAVPVEESDSNSLKSTVDDVSVKKSTESNGESSQEQSSTTTQKEMFDKNTSATEVTSNGKV